MYFDRRWQSDLGVSILVANIHRGSGHPGLWPWRERGEKNVLLPLSRFDTYPRWPPVTQSLRSRRSYGKIADCDQSNSISQKKQRYIYSLLFLQLTSACPSISCVPCFTCACVRSHGIVTDRIGVTAVRVGGALVDICMRKWNRTRLKSHGDYIYLIVYIWSLVYVTKQKKQVKVSSVSFTLHRTAFFFFSHESAFRPYETNESAHLNRMFLKPLRVCTNLGKKRFVIRVDGLCLN